MGWLILAILVIVGLLGATIANRRTGDPAFGFLLGFLLGPLGLIVAAIRRPKAAELDKIKAKEGLRRCPRCAEFIRPEANVCRYCQREVAST